LVFSQEIFRGILAVSGCNKGQKIGREKDVFILLPHYPLISAKLDALGQKIGLSVQFFGFTSDNALPAII
jgi:hypothetical protein